MNNMQPYVLVLSDDLIKSMRYQFMICSVMTYVFTRLELLFLSEYKNAFAVLYFSSYYTTMC